MNEESFLVAVRHHQHWRQWAADYLRLYRKTGDDLALKLYQERKNYAEGFAFAIYIFHFADDKQGAFMRKIKTTKA